VRIDPRRALPAPLAPVQAGRPLARIVGVDSGAAEPGAIALYATRVRGLIRYAVGEPPQDAVVMIRAAELAPGSAAARAVGIDADGYLLYAAAAPGGELALGDQMRAAGVARPLRLPPSAELAFALEDGRHVSVDGEQELHAEGGLALHAETRPAADVIFSDVVPMPYQRWGWLQGQRVRYFPSGPPRFRTPEDAGTGDATVAPPSAAQ
jgi:hypothetical protein